MDGDLPRERKSKVQKKNRTPPYFRRNGSFAAPFMAKILENVIGTIQKRGGVYFQKGIYDGHFWRMRKATGKN